MVAGPLLLALALGTFRDRNLSQRKLFTNGLWEIANVLDKFWRRVAQPSFRLGLWLTVHPSPSAPSLRACAAQTVGIVSFGEASLMIQPRSQFFSILFPLCKQAALIFTFFPWFAGIRPVAGRTYQEYQSQALRPAPRTSEPCRVSSVIVRAPVNLCWNDI